ncbi:hypothetical protein [Blastococcus goldschmidtiae]|uniref:Uncharacterized protein n=1 Tax=Blastococcus goldschmidtiae TaxID=3075546 RepID=A0ABU2KDW9_9ACTN|nr:hypothetical protein [Blastococcus sp. DSM 46792]MDT0278395.1 hypothetical protein [Blastococcus sp. DSM 46792]
MGGQDGYEGPPRYGQPHPGQPPYNQWPHAQPPYGQPYGQAPYGQERPGATVPPWGQGSTSTAGKGSKAAVVVAIVGALAIVGLAVALFVGLGSDDGGESGIPAATSEPEGLGDDPELDDYAEECHGGDMEACDDLYRESPEYSAYELYGGTCAGRQSNSDAQEVYCVEAFPPAS